MTRQRTTLSGLVKSTRYALVAVLLSLGAGKAGAQNRSVRFEITQVSDSTFRFPRGAASWVKPGEIGIAVDPRRRDALVARFRVVSVDSGLATAVITGQTTRVATEHIVVMTEPQKPWYRTMAFWGGTLLGFVAGALIVK